MQYCCHRWRNGNKLQNFVYVYKFVVATYGYNKSVETNVIYIYNAISPQFEVFNYQRIAATSLLVTANSTLILTVESQYLPEIQT